jgi:hypothetical protein
MKCKNIAILKRVNVKYYYKKTRLLKQFSIPLILFFDKLGFLPIIIPLLNSLMKLIGVKKKFNDTLNYRYYANSFEDAFLVKNNQRISSKKALFFFTMGTESSYLLRQLIIAKYLQSINWEVEFLVCSGFTSACNRERVGKTRNNIPFFCNECSWGYSFIQEKTKLKIKYLEISNLDNKEIDKINQMNSIEDCIAYKTFDNIPIGQMSRVSVLRYFYQGSFNNSNEELKVYKKFLVGTYKTVKSLDLYFNSNHSQLIFLMNGTGNMDQSMIYFANTMNIKYITQESFIGSNSWIYKKNGIAIHLDLYEEWKKNSKILTQDQKEELHRFLFKMKTGEIWNTKLHTSEIEPIDLKRGVTLFTNMNFDTYVLGRNSIFESMDIWLLETINFWKDFVKDIPLYIRIHPGETKIKTPAIKYTRKIIEHLLDENIILIDSNSNINSYSLISNSNYILTYSSTVGAEAMMMGVKCITAGEAFYKSFAISPTSKNDYFDLLLKMNQGSYSFDFKIDKLESFLYYLYFDRIKHFKGFDIDRKNSRIFLDKLDKFDILLEKNKSVLESFHDDCLMEF